MALTKEQLALANKPLDQWTDADRESFDVAGYNPALDVARPEYRQANREKAASDLRNVSSQQIGEDLKKYFSGTSELAKSVDRYTNWNMPGQDFEAAGQERRNALAQLESAKYNFQQTYGKLGYKFEDLPQVQEYYKKLGSTLGGGQTAQMTAEIDRAATGFPPTSSAVPTGSTTEGGIPTGARKLGPKEYEGLRLQNNVSAANFDQFFYKDPQGNIYLKPNAPPSPSRNAGESVEDFVSRLSSGSDESGGSGGTSGSYTSSKTGQSNFVATSDIERNKLREQIKQELLPKTAMPEALNTAEERIKLRQEQGIVNDQQDLNDIRSEARLAQEELRVYKSKAGERVTEAGRLGAVSEAERNLNFRLEGLALREQALVERINTKNSFIDQAIKDKQFDYAAATDKWNQEFTINSKVNELLNAEMDDIQKDALATVTTISNLMQESSTPYEKWPSEMKLQVQAAALKAGLPKDTFKIAYSAVAGSGGKVLSNIVTDDGKGGKNVSVLIQGKDGTISLQEIGDVSGVKELTVDQRESLRFGTRMQEAEKDLAAVSDYITKLPLSSFYAMKFGPNPTKSAEFQKFEQAQNNFITAVLRDESGAQISPAEFEKAEKQYFPQPGDDAENLKQKAANRASSIRLMLESAGSTSSGSGEFDW